jgi:hypothetical protein
VLKKKTTTNQLARSSNRCAVSFKLNKISPKSRRRHGEGESNIIFFTKCYKCWPIIGLISHTASCVNKPINSCAPMFHRIGLTLISAAIAIITVIALARNKSTDLETDLPVPALLGSPYNQSSRRTSKSLSEQDSLDLASVLISVADPLVIQAGEAVRNAFNAQRKATCSSIGLYNTRGAIQYAKKAVQSNGTVLYTMEIVLGDDAIFARVALLPNKVGAKFQLILSIPGPCESGVQEQLALSALGTLIHPMLDISSRRC